MGTELPFAELATSRLSLAIRAGMVLAITLSLLSRTSHPEFDPGPKAHDVSLHWTQRLALDAVFWTPPALEEAFSAPRGFVKRVLPERLFLADASLASALFNRPPPFRLCAGSVC